MTNAIRIFGRSPYYAAQYNDKAQRFDIYQTWTAGVIDESSIPVAVSYRNDFAEAVFDRECPTVSNARRATYMNSQQKSLSIEAPDADGDMVPVCLVDGTHQNCSRLADDITAALNGGV